jgi:WD40 repeat protein
MVLCLALSAGGRGDDRTSGALVAKLDCPDRVRDVAFSPDGRLLAAGFGWNDRGGARLWNVADRTVVATLTVGDGDDDNVECVAFSPDGRWFAAANWDGDVLLWPVGSWDSPTTVLSGRGKPKSLAFSPSGAELAFTSEASAILYDLRSKEVTTLGVRRGQRDALISLSFSPDGKLVTLFRDDAVEFVDAESGKLIKSWRPSRGGFFGRSSRDGQYIIAGGGSIFGEKVVEIWSAAEGKKVAEMSDFRSGLFSVAISHSGQFFAVSGGGYGSGGDLSLWELKEAREVGFVSFGEFPIHGLAFSPDDKVLAAGSEDGFVLLYAVERIRGPEVKKQDSVLCGEVAVEDGRTFLVPLSKVPTSMSRDFERPWMLEVANAEAAAGAAGSPVELRDWALESSASKDRARVGTLRLLRPRGGEGAAPGHVIFGDSQNPDWDKSFVAKVYGDGSFVAADNSGRCLSYGHLGQLKTDFGSLTKRLVGEGLLSVPKEPLTLGASHFRTRFIELESGGGPELRSDADSVEVLLKGGPAKKREAFTRVFELEEQFINSLLKAGLNVPQR